MTEVSIEGNYSNNTIKIHVKSRCPITPDICDKAPFLRYYPMLLLTALTPPLSPSGGEQGCDCTGLPIINPGKKVHAWPD